MAFSISQSTLDQIRAANDLVEVVSAVVPLKRAGGNFVGLCPFHREKTPSFNVNPARQVFYCFGCHKGGDVFRFVQDYESVGFMEAAKRLAERARLPIEWESEGGSNAGRFLKDSLLRLHDRVSRYWENVLRERPEGEVARAYLRKRGVTEEAVQLFRLGYTPNSWDDILRWAREDGVDLELMEKGGLIVGREGGGFYGRFRGRLMFPISDDQGRIVAFSGRVVEGDEKAAKYVNSPETPLFSKGRLFFGLDKSKRALLDAGHAIVCEGQLDLIAIFGTGLRNVVAPQGTAFTVDQARLLKRYVNEVILCFDPDTAGESAALRALDALLSVEVSVRVAEIPPPHDPDSFIQSQGAEAFCELIREAPSFFDHYLDQLCRKHSPRSDRGRSEIVRSMAEAVGKTDSPVLLDTYAQKTALRLGVNPSSARAEFERSVKRARRRREEEPSISVAEEATPEIGAPTPLEFGLLRLVFSEESQWDWLAAHMDLDWIAHPHVRLILQAALETYRQNLNPDPVALLQQLENEAAQTLLTAAITEERPVPSPQRQIQDGLLRLRNHALDRRLAQLIADAANPSIEASAYEQLLREQIRLRSLKQSPLTPLNGARGEGRPHP